MTDSSPDPSSAPTFVFGEGVETALAEIAALAQEFPPVDVPGSRVFHRAMNRLSGPAPVLHEVRNVTIPRRLGGIGLRIYRPGPGTLPVALFLHGGWFVTGDLETHDTLCRTLAEAAGHVVIAMHYRRAPEHPCPAAPIDCFEAAQWIADHADDLDIDPRRFAIVGDSVGGTLAAITTLRARVAGRPSFSHQVLLYPVISPDQDSESWRAMGGTPLVGSPLPGPEQVRQAWSLYTPPGCEAALEDITPEAFDDLSGLPRTLVITAEYDPLRAEGESYAEALRQAGVPAVVSRYPGMIHGFAALAGVLPAGRDAIDEIGAFLRQA